MQRSLRMRRLLIAVGAAGWLGLPPAALVQAQSGNAGPGAGAEAGGGAAANASSDGKSLPQVSLLRLQLSKPEPPSPDIPAAMRPLRRFNRFNSGPDDGTTLTLLIEDRQKWILGLDAKESRITSFRDDRTTDLTLEKPPDEGNRMQFNPQPGPERCTLTGEVDPAGHRLTITVHSPHFPAGGATRLSLEADLVMRLGIGEKTIEQKNVNLKADTITVGPSPLLIMSQEPDERMGQPAGTQIALFHQGPVKREFRKIAFIGPDGQEIQQNANGSGSMGSIQHEYYSLARKVETCTIRLTVPDHIETVTLSVSIDTGVGFPPGARRRTLKTPEPRSTATTAAPR
jgi:hypothetical protein